MIRLFPLFLMIFLLAGCQANRGAWYLPEREVGFEQATFRVLEGRIDREESRQDIAAGSIAIHRRGELVYQDNFGTIPNGDEMLPVTEETFFDFASLTKPLVGAPLAHAYLQTVPDDQDLFCMLESIVQSRTGLSDEELMPYVASMMDNAEMSLLSLHLTTRLWRDDLLAACSEGRSPGYLYSNYAWAILPVLPYAQPRLADALNRYTDEFADSGLTDRPGPDALVAPSSFQRDSIEGYHTGRPYDPFADYLATELEVPPAHSGAFAGSVVIGEMVSGWLRDKNRPGTFGAWMFDEASPLPDASDNDQLVYQSRGGMRDGAGGHFAPRGASHGRYYYQDGYTGCLLWVDTSTETVVVVLTNASLDKSFDAWNQFSRDVASIVHRGIISW